MKKQIPNLITLCNLICGVIATWFAVQSNLTYAALFIFLGIFLDFFDGMSARLLKVASPIGKELDSLADVITSGVAPGFILFALLGCKDSPNYIHWIALLIPAFSAYRLAKFNLDERQSHSFLGLPTPANALIWASLGICFERPDLAQVALLPIPIDGIFGYSGTMWILAALSLILNLALISEIPLFALKFKNLSWHDNKVRFIFLISTLAILLFCGIFGIAVAILWYVLLSLLTQKSSTQQHNN